MDHSVGSGAKGCGDRTHRPILTYSSHRLPADARRYFCRFSCGTVWFVKGKRFLRDDP